MAKQEGWSISREKYIILILQQHHTHISYWYSKFRLTEERQRMNLSVSCFLFACREIWYFIFLSFIHFTFSNLFMRWFIDIINLYILIVIHSCLFSKKRWAVYIHCAVMCGKNVHLLCVFLQSFPWISYADGTWLSCFLKRIHSFTHLHCVGSATEGMCCTLQLRLTSQRNYFGWLAGAIGVKLEVGHHAAEEEFSR